MPTIGGDVAFGPLNMGLDIDAGNARVDRALQDTGLNGERSRPPHRLSAGQRRRPALAGVPAVEPEIVLLDAPGTLLDRPARKALIDTLHSLPQAKVLVAHEVALPEALAIRAVFFEKGGIVAEGGVSEVADRFNWY